MRSRLWGALARSGLWGAHWRALARSRHWTALARSCLLGALWRAGQNQQGLWRAGRNQQGLWRAGRNQQGLWRAQSRSGHWRALARIKDYWACHILCRQARESRRPHWRAWGSRGRRQAGSGSGPDTLQTPEDPFPPF